MKTLTIAFLLTFSLSLAFAQNTSPILKLNQPVEQQIKAGETQTFQIALQAGEFVHVEAMQKGVDVVVRLYAPDGQLLTQRDSRNSTNGPESVSYIASVKGNFKLTISVWEQSTVKQGSYAIELKAMRQPTPQDQKRMGAEALFQEANVLWNKVGESQGTTSLYEQSRAKYKESLWLWHELGEKYWEDLALRLIASIETYKEIAKLYEDKEDKKKAQELWLIIGNIYAYEHEWELAGKSYKKVFELAKGRTDADSIEVAQKSLPKAKVYLLIAEGQKQSNTGRKLEAIATLGKALEEAGAINELVVTKIEAYKRLGQIYLELGEVVKAKENYRSAFQAARDIGDSYAIVANSQNLESAGKKLPSKHLAVEVAIQTGHSDFVNSVAFSPNGKILASGSWDKTIKLWDVTSGTELRTFSGHSYPVNSVVFSPDGKTLASGSVGDIKLWDVTSGTELRTLSGHSNRISSVAFSPDGKTLASGSWDKTIKLWNIATGSELWTFYGHSDLVTSVSFSPNGKNLASGSEDKTVKLWDIATHTELHTFSGHTRGVRSIAFSSEGRTLVSGGWEAIKLWDVVSGAELRTLSGHSDRISSVAFAPDNKTLASSSEDKTVKLWDVASGKELRTIAGHKLIVWSATFSPNGKILASCSFDHTIKLWDVVSGTELRTFSGLSNPVRSATFSPDGKILASGDWNDTIRLWDVTFGQELRILSGHTSSINTITFSPDGKTLASGSWDKTIKLWDISSGTELRTFTGHTFVVNSVVFSPDGRTLASGSRDRTIKLWDVASGLELRTLAGHALDVESVAFAPDSRTLASSSLDATIKLWDVYSGSELRAFSGSTSSLQTITFSQDGKVLISSSGNSVKLWDVANGKDISLSDTVPPFSFARNLFPQSINGKMRLVASDGGQINFINYDTGERLCSLIALDQKDWVVVTPDGLFDASPGAMKLMHFVISGIDEGYAVVALEQMKDRYYQPNLLAKLLGYDNTPIKEIPPFTGEKLFPKLEYKLQEKDSAKLDISLHNRGGGIGAVAVLVNGKTFLHDVRPRGFNANAQDASFTVDLKDAPFLPGAANHIEVVARNAEGWLTSSRGVVATYKSEAATKPDAELWAIVGGVSDYEGTQLDLHFAAKDAEDFANAIKLGGYRLFGANRVHLQTLTTNNQDPKLLPTKDNFRRVFTEFQKAKPNDVLLVYLSGHGVAFRVNGDKVLYNYLTQAATNGDVKDSDVRGKVAITSDELMEWIRLIPTNKNVLVFDTCAAGAFADNLNLALKKDEAGEHLDNQKIAMEDLKYRMGFHILMGAAADKPSYETSQFNQGLLTYALLEGVKFGAVNDKRIVNVSEWFQYARSRVPKLAESIGNVNIQTPQIAAPQGETFPLLQMTENESELIRLEQERPILMRPRLVNLDDPDDVEVENRLIRQLKEASQPVKRGAAARSSQVVFLETWELPSAIKPSGSYKYDGEQVTVNVRLLRNKQTVGALTVTGQKNDLRGLVEKLIAELVVAIEKLPKTTGGRTN